MKFLLLFTIGAFFIGMVLNLFFGVEPNASVLWGLGIEIVFFCVCVYISNFTHWGRVRLRASNMAELHKKRIMKEIQEQKYNIDDEDDREGDKYNEEFERQSRWLEEMRMECQTWYSSLGGPIMYECPLLGISLPLDEFEGHIGSATWNHELSKYIDWDEFREYYPHLDTFDDDTDE